MPRSYEAIFPKRLRLGAVAAALAIAACEPYQEVGPGAQAIGSGMTVTKSKPWVQIVAPYAPQGPDQTWTLDGPALNALMIFGGVEDGESLIKGESMEGVPPPPAFSRTMDPLAIQELVGATVSRGLAGGVAIETLSLKPVDFVGAPGFEIEFAYPTPSGLEMRGYASGANVDGTLFLLIFVAPRMHYYTKDIAEVRAIAYSAKRS